MAPYDKIIKRVKDFIQTRKLRVKNRVTELTGMLTPKMAEWDRAEERAAQAERDRVAREQKQALERQAEQKRLADEKAAKELREKRVAEIRTDLKAGRITKRQAEKLLTEAGALEESLKAKAAADEEESKEQAAKTAAEVQVLPNIPAVAGNVKRKNYKAKCTDEDKFLLAFIAEYKKLGRFGSLREFVHVTDEDLSKKAREVKDNDKMMAAYPAVFAWEDRSY
jgi:hypothetical protein